MNRRTFLLSGLSIALVSDPAVAQSMTWEERRRLRQLRRRAIRRFRRRGGGLPRRARQAIARGEIQPLRHLFAAVSRHSEAEIIDVDLHETPQGWVYALRILTPQGHVRDLYFDARTLEMMQFKDNSADGGIPLPPEDLQPRALPQPGAEN